MTDSGKELSPMAGRDGSAGRPADVTVRDGNKSGAKNRSGAIPDEIWEHEQERLNPGQVEGNPTGASRDKPKAPSNSA